MTTYTDIQRDVARLCETLRGAGLPADKIDAFSKHVLEDPAVSALSSSEAPTPRASGAKFPNIKVELADLDDKVGPIIRRVSYAMSDAGVDQAEIEQYKAEMRDSSNPVRVTRRWVQVDD